MKKLHQLKIVNKIVETHDCVSLSFEIPEDRKENFKFRSGQYLTLKLNINGKIYFRNYSICSTPDLENISIAIKKVENGIVSNYINNQITIGETIEVSEPEGDFCYSAESNDFVVAIAAGSGITPIISIIKTALEASNKKVVLFYSNKTVSDSIFFNEIVALEKNYKERFQCNFYFSRDTIDGHHSGRISSDFLRLIPFQVNLTNYYLCGPESLVDDTENQLLKVGIDKKQIFKELFFVKNQPITETKVLAKSTKIKVILEDEVYNLSSENKNEPLLNVLLENDIDAPYSCRSGICSTCVCYLTKGKVTLLNNHVLSEDDLSEGKILACQAIPQTDEIEINYDL